jgi:hypothetical protein
MRISSPVSLIRPMTICLTAALAAMLAAAPAHAQGKLEARYGISVAGINIGKATWSVDIGEQRYAAAASGRASGVLSALVSGEGAVSARGAIEDGRPLPTAFTSSITRSDDKSVTRMTLERGDVKELVAESAKPSPDRVPVTKAHRHGIVDPVSALLIPVSGVAGTVSKSACQRTLAIFDGRRRYDLKLTFKRMDKVKAAKGYAGPVAVCAVTFAPKAGHRASSTLVKYLSEGRDIELWLAPVAGTRLLAPFRASVASMLGNLVVEATQFDMAARTAAAAMK